jgi:hypothetical protein
MLKNAMSEGSAMGKFWQQMPLSLRIFACVGLAGTVFFAVVVLHGISSGRGPGSYRSLGDGGQTRQASDGGRGQALAQWKQRQAQLQAAMQQCQVQMNAVTQQMRESAMSGSGMMPAPPPCEQQMPYWISQEALAETEIHRQETGDTSSDVYDVTGLPRPSSGSGGSSSSGSGSGDDGTGAVEDWDRAAIRGTGIYAGDDGEQYELPNSGYHYKDRNSGQIITTNSPDAPNDGHDYEPLQPVERPR